MISISMRDIQKSKYYQAAARFCNNSIIAKIIVLFLIWAVATIPVDLFLLVRWAVGPSGFWQELALILVAAVVIGWLQGILIFLGILISIAVITEEF